MDHETYVAVQPPTSPFSRNRAIGLVHSDVDPPSFRDSQYDIILRRPRTRTKRTKSTSLPSRYLNSDFLFAGWGSVNIQPLTQENLDQGRDDLKSEHSRQTLGQFGGCAFAGNAVLGSIFYSLPPVVAAAGAYSPISLLIATLTFFLWRPIMNELASALPIQGAPYSYLLNVTSKGLALAGAALLILDFASTAAVSAATASSYLAGEVDLPFPVFVGVIIILVLFAFVTLSGVKESARIGLTQLTFHAVTMIVLMMISAVHWGKTGNNQLRENWIYWHEVSTQNVPRQIFNGFCLSFLTLTGFETTPAYVSRIRPGAFPSVLRNMHLPVIVMDATMMLLVLALVPLPQVLSGANILSLLAEEASGKWLRYWLVVDAVCVLCGGVLAGFISACELFEQLARDRVVPKAFFRTTPFTAAPYVSTFFFLCFTGVLYASTRASLEIVSKMFAIVWLSVMALFPISLIALKLNRDRLAREPKTRLLIPILTLAISVVVFAGNISLDLTLLEYFIIYFVAIWLIFIAIQNKTSILRSLYWILDQSSLSNGKSALSRAAPWLVQLMTQLKKQPVAVLAKTDEINLLMQLILYVERNEDTSCIKLVHFLDAEKGAPSELEANARILDEAFPEITIDLIMVPAVFNPLNVKALAHTLNIPPSLMFMSCPGKDFPHHISDFGTRLIAL